MKKLSKKTIGIAGLAALALIGGTFAYYTATVSLDNPLSTGSYQTSLVEEYMLPLEDLQPGAKVDKEVTAENTGDYPVLVRVKMDEKWQRKNDSTSYKTLASDNTLFTYDLASSSNASTYYLAYQADENGDYNKTGDTDGRYPEQDATVIHKNIKDTSASTTNLWVKGTDGYWYWNGVLEKAGSMKSTTEKLLDGLEVTTNIDLGVYNTTEYYAIATSQPPASDTRWTAVASTFDFTDVTNDVWPTGGDGLVDIRDYLVSVDPDLFPLDTGDSLYRMSSSELDSALKGYADSNYTLTVTVEFVQATVDAATGEWSGWSAVVGSLDKIGTDSTNDTLYVNQ